MAKRDAGAGATDATAIEVPTSSGRVTLALRSVVDRLQGATLCYGEPITAEGRTVVPVARVAARGGLGFGGPADDGGGGGGGRMSATPVGYIEVTAEGTRFIEIADVTADARMVRAVSGGLGWLALLLALARRVRRG